MLIYLYNSDNSDIYSNMIINLNMFDIMMKPYEKSVVKRFNDIMTEERKKIVDMVLPEKASENSENQ